MDGQPTLDLELNIGSDEPAMDFGQAIKEKLAESVKNVDIISMLHNIVASTPEDEESADIRQKLEGVLEKYNDMSEMEKYQFTAQMKEVLASKLSMKLKDANLNLDGLQEAVGQAIMYRLALLGAGVLLFVILLVFFGYKLYKSIKDKELKREEKKKAKQMKKKK